MQTAAPDNLNPNSIFSLHYDQRQEIVSRAVALFPAFMFVSVSFVIYVTEKIYYKIKLNNILPLPDYLLTIVILSGLCIVITPLNLQMAGWNGVIITTSLYFLRGFDIVRYYMNRWRALLFVRAITYILIFIYYFLNIAVIVLGFISIYKNLLKESDSEQNGK